MKRLKRQFVSVVFLLIGVIGLAPVAVFAAPNSMTASGPAIVSSDAQSITVSIDSDLGSVPVPVVDAYVTFDPTKLEYIGINYAGSPFTADTIDAASGSNYVKISRYATVQPYPTGNALLAKITFRPKVNSGSTQIGFDKPQSGLFIETGDDVLVSTVSFTITFTTPTTPPPAAAPAPSPPSSPGGTTAPKPNTTITTTPPPAPSPGNPAATPAQEVSTVTTVETQAPQTQGTVDYKQTTYSGGTSSAVSFFAKTPVRIGLITAIAASVLILAYISSAGLRHRRYVRMTTSQSTAAVLPPNPKADGIMVGYNPTVINPEVPQQPNDGERQ